MRVFIVKCQRRLNLGTFILRTVAHRALINNSRHLTTATVWVWASTTSGLIEHLLPLTQRPHKMTPWTRDNQRFKATKRPQGKPTRFHTPFTRGNKKFKAAKWPWGKPTLFHGPAFPWPKFEDKHRIEDYEDGNQYSLYWHTREINTLRLNPYRMGLNVWEDQGACKGVYDAYHHHQQCPYLAKPEWCINDHQVSQKKFDWLYNNGRITWKQFDRLATSYNMNKLEHQPKIEVPFAFAPSSDPRLSPRERQHRQARLMRHEDRRRSRSPALSHSKHGEVRTRAARPSQKHWAKCDTYIPKYSRERGDRAQRNTQKPKYEMECRCRIGARQRQDSLFNEPAFTVEANLDEAKLDQAKLSTQYV